MTAYVSPHVWSAEADACGRVGLILYTKEFDRVADRAPGYMEVTGLYPFIGAMSVAVPAERVPELIKVPGVKYITAETAAAALLDVAAEVVNRSAAAYSAVKGRGVTLAVIDTGVYPHMDLVVPRVRIKAFADLLNGRSRPYDDNGHGTSVACAAAGNGCLSGRRLAGMAPEAEIVAVKCMDELGVSSAGGVLSAMQWVSDNRKKYDIKVCCMSFGAADLGFKDPFRLGATALWNDGIAVVAAAGNGGDEPSTIKSPGTAARVITVGALDDNRTPAFSDDAIPPFSSRGPAGGVHKPDVVAPGVAVRTGAALPLKKDFYATVSGTSIATGIVAGACCLLAEKYPGIRPDEIKSWLMKNARPICGDRDREGSGAVLL